MPIINVTELRRHLSTYLDRATAGEDVQIMRHGKVIACITRPTDAVERAREALLDLRSRACVGDVESPIDVQWGRHDNPP